MKYSRCLGVGLSALLLACSPRIDDGWPAPDDSEPGQLRAELLELLDSGASEEELLSVARERREVLRHAWSDGRRFEDGAMMPAEERAQFPESVQFYLERRENAQGHVRLLVPEDDMAEVTEPIFAFEGPGVHQILDWPIADLETLASQPITTRAWLVNGFMLPDSIELAPVPAAKTYGENHVLALRASFGPDDEGFSEEAIRDGIMNRDDSSTVFYDHVTRGELTVTLDQVLGTFDLTYNGTCEYWTWANLLDAGARSQGFEPNNFDHVVYFLSWAETTSCGWAGLATVGGRSMWMRSTSTRTLSHEFGHNLGMGHAGKIRCSGDDVMPRSTLDECTLQPTSDANDVMGYLSYRRPNAAHHSSRGWLTDDEEITIEQSGTYTLQALHGDTAGPRILKMLHPTLNRWVYVSYRNIVEPFDTSIRGGGVGAEVIIRGSYYAGGNSGDTAVVTQRSGRTWLSDGEQLGDPHSGLSITQVSHDEDSVTLEVSLIPRTRHQLQDTPEMVEELAVARLSTGEDVALAVHHQATGLVPAGMDYPRYHEIGSQHSRLITRVLQRAAGQSDFSLLDPQALTEPPTPTGYATRVEQHASVAFDPTRETFVVVSTRRGDYSTDPDGSDVHQSLLVHEIDPHTGQVTSLGEMDFGPYWLPCEGGQCANPLYFQDAEIELVWGNAGFVLVMGQGGHVLNAAGNHLILGRFNVTDGVVFDSPEDLDLRVLPMAERAKWPGIAAGGGMIALSWTRLQGSFSNRVETVGYYDDSDRFVVPGQAPIPFDDSAELVPLLLSDLGDGGSYGAWRGDLTFLPQSESFYTSFTYSGEAYNWEVLGRSFGLRQDQAPSPDPHRHLSTYESKWSHSSQAAYLPSTGGVVVIYQEDDYDFFDDRQRVRIDYYAPTGERLGQVLLAPRETEVGDLRMQAVEDSDSVLVLGSSRYEVHIQSVRWAN